MYYIKLSMLPPIEKIRYIRKLEKFLSDLVYEYPSHNEWYNKMIISMYTNFDRDIILAVEKCDIIGVAILKKTDIEKKICTLRVDEKYQNLGIGSMLVKKSIEILETERHIITVSSDKCGEFRKLFNYFGFNIETVYYNKYRNNTAEIVYNGILLPESLLITNENTFEGNNRNNRMFSSVII